MGGRTTCIPGLTGGLIHEKSRSEVTESEFTLIAPLTPGKSDFSLSLNTILSICCVLV